MMEQGVGVVSNIEDDLSDICRFKNSFQRRASGICSSKGRFSEFVDVYDVGCCQSDGVERDDGYGAITA